MFDLRTEINFRIFIAQIPFEYCQKDTDKILKQMAIINGINMKYAPNKPIASKISENDF